MEFNVFYISKFFPKKLKVVSSDTKTKSFKNNIIFFKKLQIAGRKIRNIKNYENTQQFSKI